MKTTVMLDVLPPANLPVFSASRSKPGGTVGARSPAFRRHSADHEYVVPGRDYGAILRACLAFACLASAWTISGSNSTAWSATLTWSSTATGTSWNVASNWGGAVPGSADVGLFSAASYTSQPSLSSTAGIGGIWDTGSGPITIGGTTLTIAGTNTINGNANTGIELDPGAGPLTINAPLVLANNQQWINNSASPLTVSGNISAAGSLTAIGSGILTLTGSNTFGGSLTVDGGTLQVPSGSLSVASHEIIGFSGSGSLSQSGGTNLVGGFLALGQNPASAEVIC